MTLLNKTTRKEIKEGDTVETFRGEAVTIRGIRPDLNRVYVTYANGITKAGFYPQVINAEYADH